MQQETQNLTTQQRKALHLWFSQVSEVLTQQGVDLREWMAYPIRPTPYAVKETIFKPILLAMYGKTSTNQLRKQKEIDDIYDVICKTFGELKIEIPPFPSVEELLFNKMDEDL